MDQLMTIPEVCERWRLTEYRVRQDVKRGLFPFRRLGRAIRFREADVETYLERVAVDLASTHSGQTEASQRRSRRAS